MNVHAWGSCACTQAHCDLQVGVRVAFLLPLWLQGLNSDCGSPPLWGRGGRRGRRPQARWADPGTPAGRWGDRGHTRLGAPRIGVQTWLGPGPWRMLDLLAMPHEDGSLKQQGPSTTCFTHQRTVCQLPNGHGVLSWPLPQHSTASVRFVHTLPHTCSPPFSCAACW